MIITLSKNPLVKIKIWFINNVIHTVKNYYYKHKKTHYQCCVCGQILAPYFEVEKDRYNVLTDDYGWHKLDSGKYNRWICHHCADHGFSPSDTEGEPHEVPREYTWDEWQKIIIPENKKIMDLIKEKDKKYYHYWFEYGDLED